jgi:hypothetical protein
MSGLYEPDGNDAVMGGDNPAPNQADRIGMRFIDFTLRD